MKWIEIEYRGRLRRVPAVKAQGRLWFHLDGETHVIESAKAARGGARSGASALGEPGVLKAPMPGKITKVAATLGQSVKRGQALIVMEAMKMEYTLEADRDGVVTEVDATLGAQVRLGQILLRLGEAK